MSFPQPCLCSHKFEDHKLSEQNEMFSSGCFICGFDNCCEYRPHKPNCSICNKKTIGENWSRDPNCYLCKGEGFLFGDERDLK